MSVSRANRVAIGAGGVVLVGHLVSLFRYPLGNDPAIFQYAAWALTVGDVPYRDNYDVNTPGIFALHAAWGGLFGFSDDAFLALVALVTVTCLVGAALWLRARVSPAALALGLAAGLLAFCHVDPSDRGQRELFQGALLVGAIGVGRRTPLGAGLLAGAATGIKLTAAPVAALIGASWLLPRLRHESLRSVARDAGATVLGWALPLAGLCLWLQTLGAWEAYLDVQRTYLGLHNTVMTSPWLDSLLQPEPIAVLLLGIAAIFRQPVLAALLLGNVVVFFVQRHGWPYHLGMSIAAVAPTVGLLAARLPQKVLRSGVWGTLACAALLVANDHGPGLDRASTRGPDWNHAAHLAVADHLRVHGASDDRVLTNADEQQLLLIARRRAGTRFLYGGLFSESHPDPTLRELGRARAREVRRTAPRWVVWNTATRYPQTDSLDANPRLAGWIDDVCGLDASIPPYAVYRCGAPNPTADGPEVE